MCSDTELLISQISFPLWSGVLINDIRSSGVGLKTQKHTQRQKPLVVNNKPVGGSVAPESGGLTFTQALKA